MSQGTIYRARNGRSLLCRVQSELGLETALVLYAPVVNRTEVINPIPKLHVPCILQGEPHLILMSELLALPASDIGVTVGAVPEARDDMVAAVDLLVSGF